MLKKKSGFTLIELLVVIAIIAILASILFPVFVSAKAKAQGAGCQANLRQIHSSLLMYNDDYNGRMPDCKAIGAYARQSMKEPPHPLQVCSVLGKYVGKSQLVWKCPADQVIPAMTAAGVFDLSAAQAERNSMADYAFFGLSYQWAFSSLDTPKERLEHFVILDAGLPTERRIDFINQKTMSFFRKPGAKRISRDAVPFHKNSNGPSRKSWHQKDSALNILYLDGHVKLEHGDAYADIP